MTRYITWGMIGLFGAGAFILALGFASTTGQKIGPASAPLFLSGGIAVLSLWGILSPSKDESLALEWRPLLAIVAGVLLFILTIERFGLVPATLLCMGVSYLGQLERRFASFAIYVALFAAATCLIFIFGLGLPVAPLKGL